MQPTNIPLSQQGLARPPAHDPTMFELLVAWWFKALALACLAMVSWAIFMPLGNRHWHCHVLLIAVHNLCRFGGPRWSWFPMQFAWRPNSRQHASSPATACWGELGHTHVSEDHAQPPLQSRSLTASAMSVPAEQGQHCLVPVHAV